MDGQTDLIRCVRSQKRQINESYLYPPTSHHQFFDFCDDNDDRKPSLPMIFVKDCGSPNSAKSKIHFDKSDTERVPSVPSSHFNMYECICVCTDVDTRAYKHTRIQTYTDAHIHTHKHVRTYAKQYAVTAASAWSRHQPWRADPQEDRTLPTADAADRFCPR